MREKQGTEGTKGTSPFGKTDKNRTVWKKAGDKGYKGYKIGLCTLCTLHFFDDWNYFKECLSERPQNNGPIRGYVIK